MQGLGRRLAGWLAVGMLALAGVTGGGCETKTSDRDIAFINARDLMDLLADEGERTVVVDVRRWGEYDRGHIPGAVCIPVAELRRNDPVLAGADQIVVYADSFESPLSPAAAKKLIAQGYSNVYDFRGGLDYWQDEGGDLEQTPAWVTQGVTPSTATMGAFSDGEPDAGDPPASMAAPLPDE
jgi:rhodanese-related sulfurtransferase